MQLNYVEYVTVTRDTPNLGISRKEVIQVLSDIGQEHYRVQSENQLDYLIWEEQLSNPKIHGKLTKSLATIT